MNKTMRPCDIIISHFPYFIAIQLAVSTVRATLTKHFLFTVLPKTVIMRLVLTVAALCFRV